MSRLGRHVHSCRKARGLTQEGLAERSGLAVDTIRRLEHDSFSPSLDTLIKLCGGFDLSLATFFEGYEPGRRNRSREFAEVIDCLTPEERYYQKLWTEEISKNVKQAAYPAS